MLSSLKQFASGWIAQILLVLLILSFAVWGIADIFTGFGAGSVATVGKAEVSVASFQRRYQDSVNNLQRRFGSALTFEQAAQLGIPTQVLSVLVAEATLDSESQDMGLGLSNDALGRLITTDPSLIGPSGVYSQTYLEQLVFQQGFNLDDFVTSRRDQYVREQIINALAGGLDVPDAYVRAVTEFRDEQRTIDYAIIEPQPAATVADPSDTVLEAFFTETAERWRSPELRSFRYFVLSPDTVARLEDVGDAEIADRYEEQIARFSVPERRTIEQIVFDSAEAAGAAAAGLSSGTTFEATALDQGLAPADTAFGTFTRAEIADEPLADAAFGLEIGQTSGVIDGRFGPVILRVTDIATGSVQPLESVREQLRGEIARERAAAEIDDLHDTIEDARAGGTNIVDASAILGLPVVAVDGTSAEGVDENGDAVGDLPVPDLVAQVFGSDVGLENDPIRVGRTYVWYDVTAVAAPRDRPLTEVRDRAIAAWKDAELAKSAQEQAEAIRTRLEEGEAFATVVAESGLEVARAEGLTRGGAAPAGLAAEALTHVFDGPVGHTAVVSGVDPLARAVIRVADVATPAFFSGAPNLAAIEAQLDRQIAVDLIQLYVTELQSDLEIRYNQAALEQLISGVGPSHGG